MSAARTATSTKQALKVLIGVMALLLLGAGAVIVRQSQGPVAPPRPPSVAQTEQAASTAKSSIVYGTWEGNNSVIHQVNADGTGDTTIARLPLGIKSIHPLANGRFLYIADVDASKDHGSRIAVYDASTKTEQTIVSASSGWGIDSAIVSADGAWVAYWEVQLGPDGQLVGGLSRVYTAQLNAAPSMRALVYDESAQQNKIVHYPLFFDHQGRLYTDGFSPNGAGWNQGLEKSAVIVSVPNQGVSVLQKGSYNSDPTLSPVADMIAFTGYDGTYGTPMTEGVGSSVKATKESLNPNTISLLDLNTNTKRLLRGEPGRLFYDLTWKSDGTQLFARSYAVQNGQLADPKALVIDVATAAVTEMNSSNIVDGVILSFGPDGLITGVANASGATANLGRTYSSVLAAISTTDGTMPKTFSTPNGQFISSINSVVDPTTANLVNPEYKPGSESLQLATFTLKPELENRTIQQNDVNLEIKNGRPRCRLLYQSLYGGPQYSTTSVIPTIDPANMDMNSAGGRDNSLQLGKFGPGIQTKTVTGSAPSFSQAKPMLQEQYKCYDSPLYLYPTQPTDVSVRVSHADILSTNLAYTKEGGWNLHADPSGKLIDADGTSASSIQYAYGTQFTAPVNGYLVSRQQLAAKLQEYGTAVGLQGQELTDYVDFWLQELPRSPWYFMSHMSNPSALMEFSISPKPDTFLQTIMYFKPLSAGQAQAYRQRPAPVFSPIPSRHGFTAVDWSGIIDR